MKKHIKLVIFCLSLSLMVISLSSCGKTNSEIQSDAEKAFLGIMDSYTSGDVDAIRSNSTIPNTLSGDAEITDIALSALSDMTYEIKSISVENSKNVSINADVTVKNSQKIMEKYIGSIVALVSSSEYQSKVDSMTHDEYIKIMNDELTKILTSDDIEMTTKNIDINLTYSNNSWKISNADLCNTLVGNTIDAISQIRQ